MERDNDDNAPNKRTSKGKQEIEIKKIEKKSARHATFTKRRNGLSKKCSKMCTEFGAEYAVVAISEAGNVFFSGSDEVVQRFIDEARENDVVEPDPSKLEKGGASNDRVVSGIDDEFNRVNDAIIAVPLSYVGAPLSDRADEMITIVNEGSGNSNHGVQESGEDIDVGSGNSNHGVQEPGENLELDD